MKTTIKTIKLTLAFCLLTLLPLSLFAAPPAPGIYICGTGTVTLKYSGTYVLKTGDKVVWQKVVYDQTGTNFSASPGYTAITKTYNGTATDTDLTVTGGLAADQLTTAGDHYWVAHVIGIDPIVCTGDVSDPVDVYMLPAYGLTLTPTASTYCGNAAAVSLDALATPAGGATIPSDIEFEYDWTGTTAGAGAVDANDAKKFVMSATTAQDYTVVSNAKYKSKTGLHVKSANDDGCKATKSETIKVIAAPTKATISVS